MSLSSSTFPKNMCKFTVIEIMYCTVMSFLMDIQVLDRDEKFTETVYKFTETGHKCMILSSKIEM